MVEQRTAVRNAVLALAGLTLVAGAQADIGNDQKFGIELKVGIQEADMVKQLAKKQLDKAIAYYTSNATFTFGDKAPEYTGTADIKQQWTNITSHPRFSMYRTLCQLEVNDAGDTAMELGLFLTIYADAQGRPVGGTGQYATTWGKQSNGTWLITGDNFETSTPTTVNFPPDSSGSGSSSSSSSGGGSSSGSSSSGGSVSFSGISPKNCPPSS